MDVIFANGDKANFEQMLYSAAKRALADMITTQAQAQEYKIDPNRIYNLKNPELYRLFAVENLKQPATFIARKLRAAGIDVNMIKKSGSTVTGYQLINYFDALQAPTYLSKAL